MPYFDVMVIGAGAAGLMCAIEAGKRGRSVLVLDHANKPGKKILMSGGGRCNFTNYNIGTDKYLSHNPHFFKSALSRYTQWDFIALVNRYGILFHEKVHGQLFCDDKAKDIVNMLLAECELANAKINLNETVGKIEKLADNRYKIITNKTQYECESLVIATGGLSIPTMGATPFGYKIAEQFGIKVWPTRAGLVPVTLKPSDLERYATLSGISNDSTVSSGKAAFRENILFTHRGLSGPAILQISNYWQIGETLNIDLLPEQDCFALLKQAQREKPKTTLREFFNRLLPKRVVGVFLQLEKGDDPLQSFSHVELERISTGLHAWSIRPHGTEGYRTAEVTLGGVDCDVISSKTMEAQTVKGLYFIGEVLDVTGWLGGYNFQWAWSSGWAAGQAV
jgi:predicted Rossmann fold flavoprotein